MGESFIAALNELTEQYQRLRHDQRYIDALKQDLTHYVGRPSPLYFAKRLTEHAGGAQIYLKREDLNHTGSHKVNNCIGQALLAKFMGKPNVIAETGAGQHGVAVATVAARFGMPCKVFMGAEDVERQALNVYRMELLGAKVIAVDSGSRTLKDAMNEALRYWVTNIEDTYYIIGTVAGPHPYPLIVRDLQKVIGEETKQQCLEQIGQLPDSLIACVGGGSNAMGLFYPFIEHPNVELIGVEAAGNGLASGQHAAPLNCGKPGILHGNRTYLMTDQNGQIEATHSISAGLDYPGVGPEHAWLKDTGRARYASVTDSQAFAAFKLLTQLEGIMPALESSHAIAYGLEYAKNLSKEQVVVINVSGRGDKDMHTVTQWEQSAT